MSRDIQNLIITNNRAMILRTLALRSCAPFAINFRNALALRVFHHHHGIGAQRHNCAGHNLHSFARRDRQIVTVPGPHLTDYAKKR